VAAPSGDNAFSLVEVSLLVALIEQLWEVGYVALAKLIYTQEQIEEELGKRHHLMILAILERAYLLATHSIERD